MIKRISGNIVDVLNETIYSGTLVIQGKKIVRITRDYRRHENFIIPGLIDSHVHIESSLLMPSEFARLAVRHGTVAVVSDPHEIANVLGIEGINFMIENSEQTLLKFYFGAPSCVPATAFETAGAELCLKETESLLKMEKIRYLSEMMNFPGVICDDPIVMSKIELAKKYGKNIDGHAPNLSGSNLKKYISAGITTDHETTRYEEGIEKLRMGIKLQIREGSAEKDFEALIGLVDRYPDDCMFCSDDKHPDDLVKGHINDLVKRALHKGIDRMKVLKCACVNPVRHYNLDVGLLQEGDYADFVVIDNFTAFNILKTYINGEVVSENGESLLPRVKEDILNYFNAGKKAVSDFLVESYGKRINVIDAIEGQLITEKSTVLPKIKNKHIITDIENDILKIVVINRYKDALPAIGFIRGFGFKRGAIASSIAHDSHNIIAVGVSDGDITEAVNLIIENKGGLSVVHEDVRECLRLPIAGLMSDEDGFKVAEKYSVLNNILKQMGSSLKSPYMTLSFMALLVIPKLKLSDRGLFDAERFEFIELQQS